MTEYETATIAAQLATAVLAARARVIAATRQPGPTPARGRTTAETEIMPTGIDAGDAVAIYDYILGELNHSETPFRPTRR
jgi:hypothetical protein